jgi:hypothetical protein
MVVATVASMRAIEPGGRRAALAFLNSDTAARCVDANTGLQ